MADVKLRIIAEDSSINQAFGKTISSYNKLSSVSKKSLEDQKKGFKDVATEAEKANKKIADEDVKVALDKNSTSIKGLKQQIREYTNEAIKAGETSPIGKEFLKKAGEAKDRLTDIQKSVRGLGDDTKVFKGLTEGATTAAAAFSVFQGVSALLGEDNKDLQKTLVKLQGATAILSGLTQIQNALQKESALRLLISDAAAKVSAVGQKIYGTAVAVMSGKLSLATVATNVLSIATKALLGPIGIALTILSAVATAFALFSSKTKISTEELIENTKATNENTNAKREQLIAIAELQDAIDVELGILTQGEADRNKVINKFNDEEIKLKQDQNIKKLELSDKYFKGEIKSLTDLKTQGTKLEQDFETDRVLRKIKLNSELALLGVQQSKDAEEEEKEKNKKVSDEQKQAHEKYLQLQKEFLDALKQLQEKANKAEVDLLEGSDKIKAQLKFNLEELDVFRKFVLEKGKLANKDFEFSEEQTEQFNIIRLALITKAEEDILAVKRNATAQDIADTKKAGEDKLKLLQNQLDLEILQIENREKLDGLKKVEFENNTTLLILKAKKENFERQIALLEQNSDIESKIQVEKLKQLLNGINAELNKTDKKFSLAKLLGVEDGEEFKAIIEAFGAVSDAVGQILEAQIDREQQIVDRRKELNDEDIQNRNDRLNQLNNQLAIERDLAEKGLANNLDLVHRQIAEEEKARRDALAVQASIQAQEAELAKKKERVDTLKQASSIITAVANIIEGWSTVPLIGSILGIIAAAGLVSSFVVSKAKIRQLKKGGRLEGPSHDEGGMRIEGTDYEVEGEEWFVNKKSSKKYDKLLKRINEDDTFGPPNYEKLLAGTGVVFDNEVAKRINKDTTVINNSELASNSSSGVEKRLESMENKMTNFFGFYKGKPQVTTEGKKTIIKKGDLTIIKNKR